jgi:hypothetical protein
MRTSTQAFLNGIANFVLVFLVLGKLRGRRTGIRVGAAAFVVSIGATLLARRLATTAGAETQSPS